MIRSILTFSLFLVCAGMHGQADEQSAYRLRRSMIDTLLNSEKYSDAAMLIDKHIDILYKNGWSDSVFRMVYPIGRANWKSRNADSGVGEAQSLTNWVTQNDRDTSHQLSALSDLSWISYEAGKDDICLQADKQYAGLAEKYSEITVKEKTQGFQNLGFDYLLVGNARDAAIWFAKAIAVLSKDTVVYRKELISAHNSLGACQFRLGHFKEAKSSFSTCMLLAHDHDDDFVRYSNIANCYGNLCLIVQEEGNLILARRYMQECVKNRKLSIACTSEPHLRAQETDHLVKAYGSMASIYLKIGEFQRTEELLNVMKKERDQILDEADPRRNLINESFASLYLATGEYDRALINIEIYIDGCIANYGMNSFWTGSAFKRKGQILLEQRNYAEAIEALNSSIAILSTAEDEDVGQELATSYLNRAEAYQQSGPSALAIRDLNTALLIYSKGREQFDPVLAKCNLLIGEVALSDGNASKASEYAERALAILGEFQSQYQLDKSRISLLIPNLAESYHLRSRAQRMSGDPDGAMVSLNQAIEHIRSSTLALEGEESQLMYVDSHSSIFDEAQDVCYLLYEKEHDEEKLHEFFSISEENKTLLLRQQLNGFRSIAYADIPDSILQREQLLRSEIKNQITAKEDAHLILEQENAYDQFVISLKKEYPEYYSLKYKSSEAAIKPLQQELLENGTSLLEFMLTDSFVYAFVISRKHIAIHRTDKNHLNETIDSYNQSLIARQIGRSNQLGFQLYSQLFLPIEKYLDGSTVLIVPDEELFKLNFETLPITAGGGSGQLLIHQYTISYLLSAATALQFRRMQKPAEKGLMAFAPGFTDELKSLYASESNDPFSDNSYLHLIKQPFALRTAKQVAGIFNGDSYTETEATESNFRTLASNYGIIHLGTHTEINNLNPLLSRLMFTRRGSDTSETNDGFLHAYEIFDLSLRAELAVLTACETGSGKQSAGEGIRSLAYSFAYAGCPSVVMSLWQIDEKTSSEIIETFYRKLSEGLPKNEALRMAKLEYLEAHPGELSHPYYWAGLVLLGDSQPIHQSRSFPWALAVGAPIIVAILLAIRRRRRRRLASIS